MRPVFWRRFGAVKVTIIGGGSKKEHFDLEAAGEVWGLNAIRPAWVGRWDRMFNIHMHWHLVRDWEKGLKKERAWVRRNPDVPFYVTDDWPKRDYPSQVVFPRDDLAKQVRGSYHAGSFDWMVAFAIHLGAEEIALHGVGLNLEFGEPISARACLEYWCGYAEGLGVTVTAAPDCELFKQFHLVKSDSVYGYDDVQIVEDRTKKDATDANR